MSTELVIESYVVENLSSAPPRNRATSPVLPAGLSEQDVVIQWLKTKIAGDGRLAETTLAQYVVEARRLFWYARWIDTPISEWTLEEAGDYLSFLKAPDKAAICTGRVPRGDPRWTPFRKALSKASARQSQVIAGSLFKWLVAVQYLRADPFAGYGLAGKRRQRGKKQKRFVGQDGIELARDAIAARECRTDRERAKQARDLFVMELFTKTGLRTSEAINASMGSIQFVRFTAAQRAKHPEYPEGVWMLEVESGKGGQRRTVSCAAVMGSLQDYRVAYGLSSLPAPGETTPLLLGARRRTPELSRNLSARGVRALRRDLGTIDGITDRSSLYRLVKAIFKEALAWWDARDPVEADKLERASTHWLRHSFAKNLVASGADLLIVANNLGHADLNTTRVYIDDEETARAFETEKFLTGR
ncbi:tyrosine-type recombinase/integrase [Paraburkholderia humisilvae]|uniref:Tyrosine recombinase XerC n=1 Tax=Paraburkholderia humisilvae TaxID=627669 RepID=A0A6J5ELF0_9BURK|nr:tyrosine-type recombinase/integrase [Paraburkholderia humisilvae]CAB3767370.1 Tyrosine recombinase XerC [Paraburkholderia humisilvae]